MKLIKVDDIYTLMDGDKMIASSDSDFQTDYEVIKLSKQNCDEIFGVTDVKDIRKSVNTGVYLGSTISNTLISIAIEQSLLQQPTEIEIEIEMKSNLHIGEIVDESYSKDFPTSIPKLDENGCLILKNK